MGACPSACQSLRALTLPSDGSRRVIGFVPAGAERELRGHVVILVHVQAVRTGRIDGARAGLMREPHGRTEARPPPVLPAGEQMRRHLTRGPALGPREVLFKRGVECALRRDAGGGWRWRWRCGGGRRRRRCELLQ